MAGTGDWLWHIDASQYRGRRATFEEARDAVAQVLRITHSGPWAWWHEPGAKEALEEVLRPQRTPPKGQLRVVK